MVAWLACSLAAHAQAVPLPGLPNTGSGAYTLTGPASPAMDIEPHPWWVGAPPGTSWIGPSDGTEDDPIGVYTYTVEVDLAGFFAHTAVLTGNIASDNAASIFVNGVDINYTNFPTEYRGLEPFAIATELVDGVNVIEFRVNNGLTGGANPTGLLVSDFTGTAVPRGAPILAVDPLQAGQLGTGTVDYATPFAQVAFVWSASAGATTLSGGPCPGLVLDLAPPVRGPILRTADDLGTALATGTPPTAGPTLHFQAIDLADCTTTNTVTQTVQ